MRVLLYFIGSHYQQTVAQSFTLQLADSSGNVAYIDSGVLSSIEAPYAAIFNAQHQADPDNITKLAFQTFRVSLEGIQSEGRLLDLSSIQSIGFIFDQTDKGKVAIDDIEFSN